MYIKQIFTKASRKGRKEKAKDAELMDAIEKLNNEQKPIIKVNAINFIKLIIGKEETFGDPYKTNNTGLVDTDKYIIEGKNLKRQEIINKAKEYGICI